MCSSSFVLVSSRSIKEQCSKTKARVTGLWDKSGIMIVYLCQSSGSLKSHLQRLSASTASRLFPQHRRSQTHILPSAAGESILSTLQPLSGCINATEASAPWSCHLTGFRDFNSGTDFNRFSLRSDFLSQWGMLMPRNSLVSATLAAGNSTVVCALLSLPLSAFSLTLLSLFTGLSLKSLHGFCVFIMEDHSYLNTWKRFLRFAATFNALLAWHFLIYQYFSIYSIYNFFYSKNVKMPWGLLS